MNIKVKNLDLKWCVLVYDSNSKQIKPYNIIRQDLIDDIVKKYRKKELKNIEELRECVRSWAFYHYSSRCEYEIMAGDLFQKYANKIDCYTQILMNLDRLTEYISREMRLFL